MEKCLCIFALQYNSALTACFIVDKDMSEIAAFGAFSGVPVNLCQFHISQTVERYLRKELGRGYTFVRLVVQMFMKQVCTESEEEFGQLTTEISRIVPQPVVQYFRDSWWTKRHLWAACCNTNVVKLNATTTNTLESYHSKINKKTIIEKLTLCNAFLALVAFNDSKITESQRKALLSSTCEVYDHQDTDPVFSSITKSMTRFGSDLIKRELVLSREITYSVSPVDGADYWLSYKDRSHHTSVCTCSCSTHGHLKIPCRHIFFLRCFLQRPVFSDSLVPQRFKQSSLNLNRFACTPPTDFIVRTVPSTSCSSSSTVEGRYKQAKTVCDNIVHFLSILGKIEFEEKLTELKSP